jgi:ferric iron reductase protein FhuF
MSDGYSINGNDDRRLNYLMFLLDSNYSPKIIEDLIKIMEVKQDTLYGNNGELLEYFYDNELVEDHKAPDATAVIMQSLSCHCKKCMAKAANRER